MLDKPETASGIVENEHVLAVKGSGKALVGLSIELEEGEIEIVPFLDKHARQTILIEASQLCQGEYRKIWPEAFFVKGANVVKCFVRIFGGEDHRENSRFDCVRKAE